MKIVAILPCLANSDKEQRLVVFNIDAIFKNGVFLVIMETQCLTFSVSALILNFIPTLEYF
jgi:hypothetical protein